MKYSLLHGHRKILGLKNVAVVGCSRDESKDAHLIPKYLKEHGCHIIPHRFLIAPAP